MNISLEELVVLVINEVVKELQKRGINIDSTLPKEHYQKEISVSKGNSKKLDFTGFITPLITEEKVFELNENITEIIVPVNTIITPSAMDIIRKRKIKINKCNKIN